MKQAYRFCLCILIVFGIACSVALAQEEWMPDPNLRRLVREKLGIPNGIPLTQLQMQRLYGLVSIDDGIESLQGLEHAVNMDFLHLSGGSVSDLAPLMWLENLRALKLYSQNISDISALLNLVTLENLELHDNNISDIRPLSNLVNLKRLQLHDNQIVDFTPLLELQIDVLSIRNNPGTGTAAVILNTADSQICDVHQTDHIFSRVQNREYPSIFGAWHNIINLPTVAWNTRLAYHDLYFCCPMFGLYFLDTPSGLKLMGDIEDAKRQRREITADNPNMVFLVAIPYYSGIAADAFPEDWQHWLKDENGKQVLDPFWSEGRLDFTQPVTQDWIVDRVKAVAQCGLFDGIFFDHWNEDPRLEGYYTLAEEHAARDIILQRIRSEVGNNFLIMVNANEKKIPRWARYVNGLFMETFGDIKYPNPDQRFEARGYTHEKLPKIEETLIWADTHLQTPQINGLEGFGITHQLPDSPDNKRWMRLFTTMSLTLSDAYVLYNIGNASQLHIHRWENTFLDATYEHRSMKPHVHDHHHYWYDFWDAALGTPTGEKAQLYENREGLFIREFTNGWAVYNRSGKAQEIRLPEQATGVERGLRNTLHVVPDLDGEIYLKRTTDRHDVNEDGIVNILDLVAVANGFGENAPDVNGDGVVNVLDLVAVANVFGQ